MVTIIVNSGFTQNGNIVKKGICKDHAKTGWRNHVGIWQLNALNVKFILSQLSHPINNRCLLTFLLVNFVILSYSKEKIRLTSFKCTNVTKSTQTPYY